ncbi:DUF5133 domain-containing protein [Streptomyces sp. NPDC057616]|uniref:DUF5133 domain-containing protein n=1 Tax=Streptomyces sp. NPDC057616 TaxID=3346183 RepID=UPI0036AA439E
MSFRGFVEAYETVLAEDAGTGRVESGTREQDLTYTLCVSTGTRDVRDALQAPRRMLAAAGVAGPETARAAEVPPEPTEIGAP